MRIALTSDTVRVGDVFGLGVQVEVPRGGELLVPDTLALSGDIENAARKRVRIDTLPSGNLRYLVTYPIAAWRPGAIELPSFSAIVQAAGAQREVQIAPPPVTVASVLPADTAGIQPKPLRDVWGANRLWWPLVLLALLILAILAALIWWWRRRRRRVQAEPIALVPEILPRDWVLRELDRVAAARYIERNELRPFYIDVAHVLREYAARLDSGWSSDLTTTELAAILGATGARTGQLMQVLSRADLVKFARHQPAADEARADLQAARDWATAFEKPLPRLEEAA
ncbi:MAG TPA: DUF4381 family protein [Longimicrobiales bacterium]|nr:DUF4381 family protein [Longimicrobiales bacterium]